MSSLKPSPVTTPGQQRRTGQRIIISSASSHGTPPPAGAPAPSYRMDPSSLDSSGVARRGTAVASGTPPPHHHEGGGTVASSARVLPSSGGWGDMEHNKCLAALDALVHSMRSLHDQDDKMASAAAAGTGAAAGVDALHQQEVNELHLITTALHHKDIVGLFSLLTVFWSTRNHVVRDVQALEHRLLCPSGVGIQRPPAQAAGESKAAASTTTSAAVASIDVVLADAKRRLDDMSCAIRINVDSATPTTATLHGVVDNDAHDGDGGNTRRPPSLLHHEAIKERCSALEWHRHVLDHGNFADMVALSIDLQQEYQLSQAKLWQPFQAMTTQQQVAQTSGRVGPSLSWQGSVLTDAMLVSAPDASFEERRHYGLGDATSAPLDDGGSNMASYLAGLRGMVQNALESQGSVQHEVSQLLEAYASKVQDYVAPPVMRLLVPQSLRDGRDVDEDHHEALLPDAAEVHDPLSAVGGASIPLSLSLPQQQQSTSLYLPDDDASRAVGAMWRLIKFVPLDVAQGESFLQILQRAYGARDGNDARSSGPGMGARLDQEQLNVRHIFCPVRKCPLVDIPDAWLPPDPRIHTNTNSAVGSSTRTKRYQNLLDAVIRTPMVVAVRVVASLRSVGPAIKALASQTTQLEKDILPTLHRQISDARQQLWDAEIRHIERRTTRKGGDTNDDDGAAATVKRLKDMIVNLEAREAYCHQSLTQCGEHLRALVSGDLAALSAMLTVSTTQVAAGSASVVVAADGSTTTTTWGVPERVVYVCKELPRGADIESFADAFGVAVEDLHVFEDAVACEAGSVGNAASPSSPRRASLAGGGGGGATGLVRRTMVYLPMRVPVTNAFEQDLQLTRELEAYAKEYPTFPPNTEILEQLASLRRGDVNTMSALLSASRSKRQALDATSQATALKRKVDDLQQEATTLLRQSDALRRDLRDAESALREKTLALERLEWHHATPTQAPPTTHRSGAASPPQQGETNNDHHDQNGGGGDAYYTPDNFIARGLTPWQAVEELVAVAVKKDADILSLQASLKRLQREQEQNTRSAMLRNSSSWRQKQVLEVETVVDGLKNELRDATLRGVELTARCVQLERLNESLKRDVAVAKEERTASCALLQSSQEEMAHLQAALQDAQARAHTAERDATAQAQLHVQRRDTFAAKEIPSGMTPEEFLKFLGVKGVAAELALAKGPVYDALSNTHFLYVPVQVERTSWSHEDLRLQAEIEAAASALIVQTKNKNNRRTVDGGGDAAQPHGQPVLLHAELLEQLSALRNGDSVALSALIRTYRGKLQEFMLMYGGADAAASGADSPSVGVDSLREEDDLAWSTIKEGRAKVTLLRAALRHADSERMQWKTLCEEYQESETESSTRVASLEEAKHAISQRLSATQLLLESRDKDIASLKERIKGLDDDLQRTQRRLVEAGDRATRDNDVLLEDLKLQLDETRAAHHVAVVALQQRVDHDARTIAALRNALDEMGVELVADD